MDGRSDLKTERLHGTPDSYRSPARLRGPQGDLRPETRPVSHVSSLVSHVSCLRSRVSLGPRDRQDFDLEGQGLAGEGVVRIEHNRAGLDLENDGRLSRVEEHLVSDGHVAL